MDQYNVIAQQQHVTVMSHYEALPREDHGYQSEAELEQEFIHLLTEQGYERVNITNEKDLIANLRQQICRLNNLTLSDTEWKQLFDKHIASPQMTIEDKTERIQRKEIVNITMDNGESQNIKLIDKTALYNNHLQVLNQYVPEGGNKANRYDVTILVNGLPLVHCELKRRGVPLKEAFNQITAMSGIRSGQARDCMTTYKSLSFPTAPKQSIIAIQRASLMWLRSTNKRSESRRSHNPLSLLLIGQTLKTTSSLTFVTSQGHSWRNCRC